MLILVLTFPASASRPRSEGTGGGGGDTAVLVGDDNVTRSGVPSTSQDTGNLCWSGGAAAFISAQTSTVHSLDILRTKLTLLQCVVCAHARERWSERASENECGVWVKASRQAEEQSTAETPVSSVSSDRGLEAEAGRVNTAYKTGWKLDRTLRFWCFCVVCVGVWVWTA